MAHDKGQLLGGLLHYITAASNHTAKAYRRGIHGKQLYHLATHRTQVYQSRFADYIIIDVLGSHKAWRTSQLANPHARAPHYHNPTAQTDCFELAFDDSSKRWDGSPAIHVAIYGVGRQDRTWMAFRVPPYMVEQLTGSGVTPKTVKITKDEIYVTYERTVPDREPTTWAGVDMNADNNTYAFLDGSVMVQHNDFRKQYNKACCKVLSVKRRSDIRVMAKQQKKAWDTYHNRVKNAIGVEARRMADLGCAVGYEMLSIHKLYTENGRMAPYVSRQAKDLAQCRPAEESHGECRRGGGAAACRGGPGRHVRQLHDVRQQAEARHRPATRQAQPVVPTMQGHPRARRQRGRQRIVPDGNCTHPGLYRPERVDACHTSGHAGDAAGCRQYSRHEQTAKSHSDKHHAAIRGPQCRRRLAPAGGAQTGAPKFRRRGVGGRTPGWTTTAGTGRGRPMQPSYASVHNLYKEYIN